MAIYADDVIFYLTDPTQSVIGVMDEIKQYSDISGYKEDWIYLKEIAKDRDFKPSMIDNTFKMWAEKGLKILSLMITNKGIETFENLSKKFNLPNTQKVRSYLIKTTANNKTLNDIQPLIIYIVNA